MTSRALIAGATCLIGGNLAEHLVSKGWEVHGLARKPESSIPGVLDAVRRGAALRRSCCATSTRTNRS